MMRKIQNFLTRTAIVGVALFLLSPTLSQGGVVLEACQNFELAFQLCPLRSGKCERNVWSLLSRLQQDQSDLSQVRVVVFGARVGALVMPAQHLDSNRQSKPLQFHVLMSREGRMFDLDTRSKEQPTYAEYFTKIQQMNPTQELMVLVADPQTYVTTIGRSGQVRRFLERNGVPLQAWLQDQL